MAARNRPKLQADATGLKQTVPPMETATRSEASRPHRVINHFWDQAKFAGSGELHVEGWAVCASGIAEVAVHLAGERLGEAVLGLPRPDVGRQFKTVAMAGNAGFRFQASLPDLAAGDHDIRLVIRNGPGDERSETKRLHLRGTAAPVAAAPHPVAIEPPEFHFHLDSPRVAHGAATEPAIGRLAIQGWALARSGIAEIEVRLDEAALGLARRGLARDDVGIAYPDWADAPRSGFAFHVPPDALREGQQLVKLILRARNGQEHVEHFRIDVRNSESAADLIGVRQPPGDSGTRFAQLLPTLLPVVVDQVYRAVLHRPADRDSLDHHVHLLAGGKADLRRLVDDVYESPEYRNVAGPAAEEVRKAYRFLFEREPTQPEITNHVQAFRGTCGSDDQAAAVLRSPGAARARLGIRPLKIEMDITNQCNIRCLMCPFSDPAVGGRKRTDLSPEIFARWADEMFSWATNLGLMFGTEPTLNQHLLSFVRTAKEYRVPNVYFSTNGMKLTPTMSGALIEAGLDEMNVSLDAGEKATFERIRRGAKWETVIGNLRSLKEQKAAAKRSTPRLHMSYVLMRSNIPELPQFVELAAELGAVVLYLTHLVSYDKLGTESELLGADLGGYGPYMDRALAVARQHDIHVVAPRTRQARLDIVVPRPPPPEPRANHLAPIDQAREAHGLPRRFARDEAKSCCPFPWHFIAIEPDGSVRPCGWWHAGAPMGNLHSQRFQEIWQGEPMRTLRRQLVTRQLGENCGRCPAAGMGTADSAVSFQPR